SQIVEDHSIEAANRRIQVRTQYALLLSMQGKYAEAETVAQAALNEATVILGEEHHSTLVAMKYLAEVLAQQGKYADSEQLYRTALQKIESSTGSDSLETANALNQLGFLLHIRGGAFNEACEMFERAIPIL